MIERGKMEQLKYEYQLQLQWIGQDETAGYVLFQGNEYKSIIDDNKRWQSSLDFVIRCMLAGLIEDPCDIIPQDPWEAAKILAIEPIDMFEAEKMVVPTVTWPWVQFYPTDLLQQVLKQHNLECWTSPPNSEFIAWLENRFAEYGVPFSDEPLVLIQPPQ